MTAPDLTALTQSLTQSLTRAHQQLEANQVFEAAEQLRLAVTQCGIVQARGVPIEPSVLELLGALQRKCSQAAQSALAQLVATSREAGTMQRAIRAYAEQG